MNLAAWHFRDDLVEQIRQGAQKARFGLAAKTEENEVVLGQQRVGDLWGYAVVVADDAGKKGLTSAETGNRVGPQFLLDGAVREATGGHGLTQTAERGRMTHVPY